MIGHDALMILNFLGKVFTVWIVLYLLFFNMAQLVGFVKGVVTEQDLAMRIFYSCIAIAFFLCLIFSKVM